MTEAAPFKPRVTPFLIGMNAAVFVAMVVRGVSPSRPDAEALLAHGANFGALVVSEGQWWRPLTAMFVHIGAVHLLFNMYALWNVGSFIERLLGRPLFLVVYLLTGLAGSFASIMWNPLALSAGASGAIFGLFGVLTGFTFRARDRLPPQTFQSLRSSIAVTLVFNLVFALSVKFLDHAAHLGGFLVGVLAGVMATASALESERLRPSWGSQLIVLATVVGLGVLADTRTKHNRELLWRLPLQRAAEAAQSGNYEAAIGFATESLKVRERPEARGLRGTVYLTMGRYDEAIDDLKLGTQEPMMKNNLAWVMVRQNRELDEALKLADAAVKAEEQAAYLGTRCWVHVARGEPEQGKTDCQAAVKLAGEDDLMDRGMLKFIAGDKAGALELWQQAAAKDPVNARDLEPWLQRAKQPPEPEPAAPPGATD